MQGNQLFKRSTSNPLKRQASQTYIRNTIMNYTQQGPPESPLAHPSLTLKKELKNKAPNSLKKISSCLNLPKSKLLAKTEEAIFSQVIGLLKEIDQLQLQISNSHFEIQQLGIAHPQIKQKVQYYGYSKPLTSLQCSQVEKQNMELSKLIKRTEGKQVNSLEEVIHIERSKYEDLKKELLQNRSPPNLEQGIKSLKSAIQQMQMQRNYKIIEFYPQFQYIRTQNQELRKKTIANLFQSKQKRYQQQEIKYYLLKDAENREQFMRQLHECKEQYKRIKKENESLKLRLIRKDRVEGKQNINSANYLGRVGESKISSIAESQIKKKGISKLMEKGGNRLGEYSNLIKRMQSLNK